MADLHALATWPPEIFFSVGYDYTLRPFNEHHDVSWCSHRHNQADPRYMRQDIVDADAAAAARQHASERLRADQGWQRYDAVNKQVQDLRAERVTLVDRVADLEAQNAALRQAVADNVTSSTMLTNMGIVNGGMNITLEGGACQLLADAFCEQFRSAGGINFVEMGFTGPDGLQLLVTMQKVDGKTPAALKREAEERVAALEAEAVKREDYIETLHAERIGGSDPATIQLAAKSAALNIMAAWRDPAYVSGHMPALIEKIVANAMRGLVAPQQFAGAPVGVDMVTGAGHRATGDAVPDEVAP